MTMKFERNPTKRKLIKELSELKLYQAFKIVSLGGFDGGGHG